MARILIVTFGTLGDLHPALALGEGLAGRGHDVAIATSESHGRRVTSVGLKFHAVRPEMSFTDEATLHRLVEDKNASQHLMREFVYPSVRGMHADLVPLADDCDFILAGELACAVPILAEQHGKPWAFFALSPISFLSVYDPSVLPGPSLLHIVQSLGPAANRFVHVIARAVSYGWWRPLRELRRELGLASASGSPLFEGKFSSRLNLALFSSVLQRPQRDWPGSTVQPGFLFHDELHASPELPPRVKQFIASGPAPIVFTLGSAAVYLARNFFHQAAEAAQALGHRAILLVGENPPPPNLPSSILAWDYLPYAQLFPHASVIVHQGGVGTTGQALRAGKPMLVMPFAHDQFDNAARVTRLGVARTVQRQQFNALTAASALQGLLNDQRAHELALASAVRVRSERGLDSACDAVERAL